VTPQHPSLVQAFILRLCEIGDLLQLFFTGLGLARSVFRRRGTARRKGQRSLLPDQQAEDLRRPLVHNLNRSRILAGSRRIQQPVSGG
jgi:hypothetical protein